MIDTKTDNTKIELKLDIRRYMMQKYLLDQKLSVLDCCQGDGLIWENLRQEFSIDQYWGVDLKAKTGRLKINSIKILQQYGWTQNIIDIDTYGSPWKHWTAMLPNIHQPIIVFLTIGMTMFKGSCDDISLKTMGINFKHKLPESFRRKLSIFSIDYCLGLCYNYNIQIVEITEVNVGNVIYMGLYLKPMKG